jgi:hypothetical protein
MLYIKWSYQRVGDIKRCSLVVLTGSLDEKKYSHKLGVVRGNGRIIGVVVWPRSSTVTNLPLLSSLARYFVMNLAYETVPSLFTPSW